MTVDGVWTAEAHGAFGWEDRGIFFFENGRTLGGDNKMFCSGTYVQSGDKFEADWKIEYLGSPRTVFGETEETIALKVTGTLENDTITAKLHRPDRPGFDLEYRLTRHSSLPQA